MDLTSIARACHEANRALCESFGDHSQPAWDDAEEWQRESALDGVRFTIATPESTPEDQHRAWMAHKVAGGWAYGPVKDATLKKHPCMVPYHALPPEQRAKDAIFRAIVKALS
jgi:hypothetical protein